MIKGYYILSWDIMNHSRTGYGNKEDLYLAIPVFVDSTTPDVVRPTAGTDPQIRHAFIKASSVISNFEYFFSLIR